MKGKREAEPGSVSGQDCSTSPTDAALRGLAKVLADIARTSTESDVQVLVVARTRARAGARQPRLGKSGRQ